MSTLILASGSASRKTLLKAAGVAFTAVPADLDEPALMATLAGQSAADVAVALAEAKACAVSKVHPGALVLGGDSVLAFDGELVSKSADIAAARALLRRLSGRGHAIHSAAALARNGQLLWRHVGEGRLVMRQFTDAFLDDYLAKNGDALLASVGCYHLEGQGSQLFARIEGDYFSILGLPLLDVLAALRKEGVLRT